MLEPRSLDTCKNTTVPIIIMLGCSKVDTKILGASMETIEFNSYREVSGDNRNANKVLATMQERARFFCKDR